MTGQVRAVRFDTKIAILLRDDLEPWQALNVTAFLASGIAHAVPDVVGQPYRDADGTTYTSMFRQPVLVMTGDEQLLTAAHEKAIARGLTIAVFTDALFSTGHDEANRAAVRAVPRTALRPAGLGLHGPRNALDKTLKGARMHP